MVDKKNFGHLGTSFQQQLLNQIIVDKEFSKTILDVIYPEYFENKYFRHLAQIIYEHYKKYEKSPSFVTIEQIIRAEQTQEQAIKVLLDTIYQIKNVAIEDVPHVQERALKFCKQQELQRAINEAQKFIDGGEFESYDAIETLIKNALQKGTRGIGTSDVFSNMVEVLDEDFRDPIPMGVPGIDKLLKGGLAKGEFGVILAPTGVGKSTFLTKIANNAFNLGYNVLQIFFEDNPKIIQRKHYTLWTGVHPDELSAKKDYVMGKVNEIKSSMPNRLILEKLPSHTLTILQIKALIRKMRSEGINIDVIVLDYIDCVISDNKGGDTIYEQGAVMRAFESMCYELEMVGWTATQGNRQSISSDVVTTDQMGGSIGKAQVAHVIISVAKSLEQKDQKMANIAIVKSRIGDDGKVFSNCKFDNAMIEIDTAEQTTFIGHEEDRMQQERNHIRNLLDKRKSREEQSEHFN
jgi:replicative DNA helicase